MNTLVSKVSDIKECLGFYDSALEHGYSFRAVSKHLLKPNNLTAGREISDAKQRIQSSLEALGETKVSQVKSAMSSGLVSFLRYGDKFCTVFDFSQVEAAGIISSFDTELALGNPFKTHFPHLPNASDVKEDFYYPAYKVEDDKQATLFFGSKRRIRERVDIDPKDLSQSLRHRLKGLMNVAAYTLDEVLNVDVVVVDKASGNCELRISNARGLSNLSKDEAVTLLSRKIRALAGTSRAPGKVNFHPCIMPLYNDKGVSDKVTKFFFEVDENGMKKEYKPYDKTDLRDETYHDSGSQAIGFKFRVFAIRKVWEVGSGNSCYTIGVDIAGSPRVLDEHSPEINGMSVTGCFKKVDYDFILSKVMPYSV